MSLDARIKAMAGDKLARLKEDAGFALAEVANKYGVDLKDAARLVSGHKTKTTEAVIVKHFSEQIGEAMLKSLGDE